MGLKYFLNTRNSINFFFFQGEMYFVKWRGYHISESSTEPMSHLTPEIIRTYDLPEITYERLQYGAQNPERIVQQLLSSNGNPSVVDFDADLFRFCFRVQSIHILQKEDFSRLQLSNSWHYKLKRNGRGIQLSFPVRLHSKIYIRKSYMNVNGNIKELSTPLERLIITSATDGMCI
jgi:hypothetical protein